MKNRSFFLILVSLSFLHISNAQSQLYEGNAFYDSTGKVYYYADDGNAYYYPDEVQRQYQRKPQSTYNTISPTKPSLIASKIEDCKQAYMKAQQKKEENAKKYEGLKRFNNAKVVDFADDGIMVEEEELDFVLFNGFERKRKRVFIYTTDQEYATGENFRDDFLYKKAGYYRYRTVMGGLNSVPAYKATEYKVSEIDKEESEKTYMQNKNLPCTVCSDYDDAENPIFGLVVRHEPEGGGMPYTVNMNEHGKIRANACAGYASKIYSDEDWNKLLRGIDVEPSSHY